MLDMQTHCQGVAGTLGAPCHVHSCDRWTCIAYHGSWGHVCSFQGLALTAA